MSDERDFDPRFDPAFQRGYVAGGGPAPQAPAVQAGEPTPQWTNPPQTIDARARPGAPTPTAGAHPKPEPAVTLDGNPWIRVLWIVAPVFVIVGLVGQVWGQSVNFGRVSTADAFTSLVLPSLAFAVCPGMVQVGLAALVGVVFLHAVRWRATE